MARVESIDLINGTRLPQDILTEPSRSWETNESVTEEATDRCQRAAIIKNPVERERKAEQERDVKMFSHDVYLLRAAADTRSCMFIDFFYLLLLL